MNDLDLAIVATLRAEARGAEMSTDTPHQYVLLSRRLDDVDRERTRNRWLAVAAAVVLVGGLAWAVSSTQQASTVPPATTPGPSELVPGDATPDGMRYTSVDMEPLTRVTLPGWTASTVIDWKSRQGAQFAEGQCDEPLGAPACSADEDLKLRMESLIAYYPDSDAATSVVDPSYGGFLANLNDLERRGAVTVSSSSEAQVGGRTATLMWLSVREDVAGAMGCPRVESAADDCFPLVAGRDIRLAVVDQGPAMPPTLLYLSLNTEAVDMAERFAEFDAMLDTVEFG